MIKLYQYLALSLLATALGFFSGLLFLPEWVISLASIILVVFAVLMLIGALIIKIVKKRVIRHIRFSIWIVYIFAFIEGVVLYPVLMHYLASLGTVVFAEVIIGTMVIFSVLAYLGHKKPAASTAGIAQILLTVLAVMVIMSITNLFLQIDVLSMLLSALGVALFSAFIFIDVNQFKTAYENGMIVDSSDYSIYVLNIYLDIINLLLDLLDLVDWFDN